MKANVLIAGGGVIGSAFAWALAERGVSDVMVVDLDLAGLYASSELNAGGARATWWQGVNVETFGDHDRSRDPCHPAGAHSPSSKTTRAAR